MHFSCVGQICQFKPICVPLLTQHEHTRVRLHFSPSSEVCGWHKMKSSEAGVKNTESICYKSLDVTVCKENHLYCCSLMFLLWLLKTESRKVLDSCETSTMTTLQLVRSMVFLYNVYIEIVFILVTSKHFIIRGRYLGDKAGVHNPHVCHPLELRHWFNNFGFTFVSTGCWNIAQRLFSQILLLLPYIYYHRESDTFTQSAQDAGIMWGPYRIAIFSRAPDTHMGSFRILYSFTT